MTTCCDLSLPSYSKFSHCTSCCATFFSPSSFDHHRVGGECVDPATRGMRSVDRKHLGPVWQRYIEPKSTEPETAAARLQLAYDVMTGERLADDTAAALLAAVPSLERWTVLDLTTALEGSTLEELADPTWWDRVMKGAPAVQADAARNIGGRGKLPSVIVRRVNATHLRRLRPAGQMSYEELDLMLRIDRHDQRRAAKDRLSPLLVPEQRKPSTSSTEHAEGSPA
jgi:hypothetical protein